MNRLMVLSIVVLFLVLTACSSSQPTQKPALPPPTQPRPTQPPPTQPPPEIDVAIVDINLPSNVQRGQNFEFTITAQNMDSGWPTACAVNVSARARSFDGGTDVPVGTAQFRNLEPGKPQQKEVNGRAPPQTGLWTLYATIVETFGCTEANTGNNTREGRLVVD